MKSNIRLIVLLAVLICQVNARTIKVSPSGTYSSISSAAAFVNAGDTIFVEGGIYSGGDFISNLHGIDSNWICIISDTNNPAIFKGGNFAFMMSDVSHIKISGFVMDGQTQNGVNIDDGGSYDTPTVHILIEHCKWLKMDATGNNDELKMSGVDSFTVRKCIFQNGSAGGSLVDMVGCHNGVFEDNRFENGGSNSIQAKGGSQNIRIQRNMFINGGQRAINIGGATGKQYFRPLNADFEAQFVGVHSNIFIGSMAPIAFVGAVRCEVVNNTFIEPERWMVRILQENSESGMQITGKNKFTNNICYFSNMADNEKCINIGAGTAPKTFIFSNNLWYNKENSNWAGPNTAVQHFGQYLNINPKFKDLGNNIYSLIEDSPAIGSGLELVLPELDYLGQKFKSPRSIGAIEFYSQNGLDSDRAVGAIEICPNPASGHISINLGGTNPTLKQGVEISKFNEATTISIYNMLGEKVISVPIHPMTTIYRINLESLPKGLYFVRVGNQTANFVKI
jgi:hypothetical protein